MLNFGKLARLILFTTLPALAMAQSAQVSSMPQSAPPQAIQATPASAANTASSPNGSEQDATATVEYVKGQLTVISHGAPLGSILKLVSTKTGALVALAPELQNEPVVGQLGPGTVREVVTSLLDSPRIGYILMGAGNDPDRLQKIVVQSRRSAARGAVAEYHPPPQEDEENKIDENGKLPSGLTPEESKMSQDEIRANWQRIRDQKLQAELLQQKQDREREQLEESQPQPPPQPPPQTQQPQPNNPPQQ
jgi:hypothetical protein